MIAALLTALLAAEPPPEYGPGRQLATLAERTVRESSGVAASRRRPGVFWTHNDSGNQAELYAFTADGAAVGTVAVRAPLRDWEDLASATVNGRHWLAIADVGDNFLARPECAVLLVEEPEAGIAAVDAVRVPFAWPDGRKDCEALAIDPQSGLLYLVIKAPRGEAAVYELASPLSGAATGPWTPRRLAGLDIPTATAADISPDGRRAIVLTYADAREYTRADGQSWAEAFAGKPRVLRPPRGKQSEAVCYGHDGVSLFLTSETGKDASAPPCPLFTVPALTAK